jgi:hypothetical protein
MADTETGRVTMKLVIPTAATRVRAASYAVS